MAAPRLQLKRGTTAPGSIFYEAEPIVRYNSGITELHIGDAGGTGSGAGTIVASESAYAAVSQMLVAASSAGSGEVRIYEDTDEAGSNFVTLKVPALAASYTLTLPTTDGDNGQFLTTDGNGALLWTTASINSFTTFAVGGTAATSGTDNIVADTSGDTFTFAEGEGINLFTNATTDTLTISAELASTTNPGVASFAAADFDVSVGGEVTINSISLTTQTDGNYVASITNGSGITGGNGGSEGAALTLALDINGLTAESAIADADTFPFYDATAAANRKATADNLRDYVLGGVSGDITINASGVATIANDAVDLTTMTTGNYVASVSTSATGGLSGGAAGSEGTAITLELNGVNDLSANTIVKWNDANSKLVNSLISDDGSTVTIGGNLTVNGTTTTVNTTNTTVTDALIELANGTTGNPATTRDSGIVIERGDDTNIFFGFDEGSDVFVAGTTSATGATNGDVAPTPITFLAGALNIDDTGAGGASNAVISYLASGGLYTSSAAGRYLQNITVDCGTY